MGSTRPSHHVEVTTLREGFNVYTDLKQPMEKKYAEVGKNGFKLKPRILEILDPRNRGC
jgi:hypothetical protein